MTLTKIDHKFTYPDKLGYDAKPNTQDCVKLTFYFSKLPNVSYEQFYGHWSTVHADLTVAARGFSAVKIQRYVQVERHPYAQSLLSDNLIGRADARIQRESRTTGRNQGAGI